MPTTWLSIDAKFGPKRFLAIQKPLINLGVNLKKLVSVFIGATLLVTALTGCSAAGGNASGGASSGSDSALPADPMACVQVTNVANKIKLHQGSFSGDPDPTDIFVATQFSITNNCDKAIVGLKGTESFQNVVGDEIFSGNFTSDLTIKAGATTKTSATRGYTFNQFEDAYGALGSTDSAKTKSVLTLTKIVFDDGTSLAN